MNNERMSESKRYAREIKKRSLSDVFTARKLATGVEELLEKYTDLLDASGGCDTIGNTEESIKCKAQRDLAKHVVIDLMRLLEEVKR